MNPLAGLRFPGVHRQLSLEGPQQARMLLGDMQHNRSRLEERQIAFLLGRNLAERMPQVAVKSGMIFSAHRKKVLEMLQNVNGILHVRHG